MAYFRKLLMAVVGALSLVGAAGVGVSAHDDRTLVEFESMTPVAGAAVGVVNDRGIKGGGLPWSITSGTGEVSRSGSVHITVKGLIVPALGRNPAATFGAAVSCLTRGGVVNVRTAQFPASSTGDSTIDGSVALPRHCKHPIVFVVSAAGSWFAMSNAEDDD